MEYLVKRINTKEEIRNCERFEVSNYQWVDGPKPETWGYMGYLEGKGLYVEMYCKESSPRTETNMENGKSGKVKGFRVCDDSAAEVFLGFADEDGEIRESSMYINFEMNSAGALYAAYGKGRKGRSHFSDEVYESVLPEVYKAEECWGIKLLIPETLIKELGKVDIENGDVFYCNFYKISETPEIEHYGTFAEIKNETPNFHLPQYFAKVRVE